MYDSKKISVLDKLIGTGIKGKPEFLRMSLADLVYSIPDLEADELHIMHELQDSIRDNKLFEYLCQRGEENSYV